MNVVTRLAPVPTVVQVASGMEIEFEALRVETKVMAVMVAYTLLVAVIYMFWEPPDVGSAEVMEAAGV